MKINKKIIIITSFLIIIAIIGGLYYFLKFKERNIVNADTCVRAGYPIMKISETISECRTFLGKKFGWTNYIPPKEETDEEIIKNYKSGNFTIIGSEINPYNQKQKLMIISFYDYKKFNEPYGCGTHIFINCYLLLKTNNNISVITRVYPASSPYWNKGIEEADFVAGEINDVPLIKFLDEKIVVLRNIDFLSDQIFFKINLETKEINKFKVKK